MINAAAHTTEAKQLWSTPGWLPREIGIIVEAGQFFCYEGEDLSLHLLRGQHYINVYELVGMVADINSGEHQKSHLVSITDGESFGHLTISLSHTPQSANSPIRPRPRHNGIFSTTF